MNYRSDPEAYGYDKPAEKGIAMTDGKKRAKLPRRRPFKFCFRVGKIDFYRRSKSHTFILRR